MWKLCTVICAYVILVAAANPSSYSEVETFARSKRSALTYNIYVALSARNLPSTDFHNGAIDPYAEVHFGVVPPDSGLLGSELQLIGKTEKVENEQNPDWNRVFNIRVNKGVNQKLWIQVKDFDTLRLVDDSIGGTWFDIDEYMANGQRLTMPLIGTANASLLIHYTTPFHFNLALQNVPPLDWFGGLSDPYIKCYFRNGQDGKEIKFYQTSHLTNVNSATWEEIIAFDNYVKGTNQFFHFKVKDHDAIDKDDNIGEAFLELDSFVQNQKTVTLPLSDSHNATIQINWEGFVEGIELPESEQT